MQAFEAKKAKVDKSKAFADFYERMKASINLNAKKQVNTVNSLININDLPDDPYQLLDKVYEAFSVIQDRKREKTEHYGRLGYILAMAKRKFMHKLCKKCAMPGVDVYTILRCKNCEKLKNLKKEFFDQVCPKLGCDNGHINTLINIGYLYINYPYFKNCRASTTNIKNFKSRLEKAMEIDAYTVWGRMRTA